jgi:hypothetical protein
VIVPALVPVIDRELALGIDQQRCLGIGLAIDLELDLGIDRSSDLRLLGIAPSTDRPALGRHGIVRQQQIVPLFSPVRMPRYNGACEAWIGAAKRRTEYLAARQGRYLDWTADDLHAAQQWANEENYPGGCAAGTPASRFAARLPIDHAERDIRRAAVLQNEWELKHAACMRGDELTDMLIAIHHRRAVRHALVEHGYLDITRRSIPQPLPAPKRAKIK